MAIYTISDDATRFCPQAMVQCGGRWNPEKKAWMFSELADAADAALELYRATRATPAMREEILSMIADGTAVAAWNHDELAPFDVDALSRERALEMLREGRQMRRVLGVHPLESQPSADPELSAEERGYQEFRERCFETRAKRSRGGRRTRGAA
ncbi:MAG: hypothetical protein ACLPSH_10160 [Vulcanimicrobiaceae bacterium]